MNQIPVNSNDATTGHKLQGTMSKESKEKKNRIFNLEPEQFSPEVNVKHHHTSTKKQKL